MNLITLSRKVPGKSFAAVKTTDAEGNVVTENPTVEFEGVNVDDLPTVQELLKLCGPKAALYLAKGYNDDAFDAVRDPFDKYIPDDMDDEKAKSFRQAMIAMVRVMNKTPDEVAQMLLAQLKK